MQGMEEVKGVGKTADNGIVMFSQYLLNIHDSVACVFV